jgi:hypothetical protein
VIACTSPRTTQLLHQRGDFARLPYVSLVFHEPPGLGSQTPPAALASSGLGDRLARCLGAGDPTPPGNLIERLEAFGPET